jgi:hypothetical protein
MIELAYKDFKIELFDDSGYDARSTDNINNYQHQYFSGGEYQNSQHAIRVSEYEDEINSCILIADGGTTGVHAKSAIIDDDSLLMCCGDSVFCLQIPTLSLRWKVRADRATCFQILTLNDKYLIHGELQISCLDKSGNIEWDFSGADIFVSPEGENEVVIKENSIELLDFSGRKYLIDFNGKQITSNAS